MTNEAARARAQRELDGFTAAMRAEVCEKRQIGKLLAIAALELISRDGPDAVTAEQVAQKAEADLRAAVPGIGEKPDFPPVIVALRAIAPATVDHLKRMLAGSS